MSQRPHIVIFNPDQWRGDVMGHMGDPAAVTPYLDRAVTEDAVSFRSAFCQNPVCTPSRCSFMSGWYPHVRGHRTMFHMMRPDEPVLLKTLKDNGYHVWWGGKNDLVPAQNGFDAYCDVKYDPVDRPDNRLQWPDDWRGAPDDDSYYSFYVGKLGKTPGIDCEYRGDWQYVLGAIDLIDGYADSGVDKPLCVYVPIGAPHPPYAVEDPYYSAIDRAKIPDRLPTPPGWDGKPSLLKGIYERQKLQSWTEDRWTELKATYYGMCARVDHQFGMLCEALKNAGIYDDTAIFFFSDHGDFTGDYGLVEKTQNTFEDVLTRVPFLIKPPSGRTIKPGVRDAMVELVDLVATVEDLTGIASTHDHFGRSLMPLVAGEVEEHRDAVFCEGGRLAHERQANEFQSNQAEGDLYWPRCGLQEQGPEHSKAFMCRTRTHKYVRRMYESDELYDLQRDPGELRNVVDDPAYAAVLAELKERMLQFLVETTDVVPRDWDYRTWPAPVPSLENPVARPPARGR